MQRILIDTDPGVDDALALMYAFRSPELRIEAITTVSGNLPVEVCCENLKVILQVLGIAPEGCPMLARGAERPLVRPPVDASDVHGEDGLGNTTTARNGDGSRKYPPSDVRFSEATAVETILEAVGKYPGELTIVALAPLTNLALAIQRDPERMRQAKQIVLMGGAFETYGNITLSAEFNIFVDPHAARIVCDSGIPLVVAPLDATHQVQVLRERLISEIGSRADPLASFLVESTLAVTEFDSRFEDFYGTHLHDPVPLIYLTNPELFEGVRTRVDVETEGRLTPGKTLAELRSKRLPSEGHHLVLTGVETERVLQVFYERVLRS